MDAVKSLWIEGYTRQVSYQPGEEVEFHVSTSSPKFDLEIARVGAERKIVHSQKDIHGGLFSIPWNASSYGCDWPVAHTLKIPTDWTGGYYEAILKVADGGGEYTQRGPRSAQSSCFFILHSANPGRDAKILIQLTTNTYNAYNNWNGHCLYAYNAVDKVQWRRVSFQRPPASQFGNWERKFVAWAEMAGYKLDYAANLDLEFHPEVLRNYKLILSVGHDEYWSWGMRDNLEKFIGEGGNAAFFSGNTCCWQVRPEENGDALVCWKQAVLDDPLYGQGHDNLLSTLWSHHLVKRPENQLTGVGFLWGGYHRSHEQFMDGSGAFTVHRPDHWIFAGTNLKRGDVFGGKDTIVGYECDGCEMTKDADGLPIPTHRDGTPENFTILASAPAQWHPDDCEWYDRWEKGRVGAACLGTYMRNGTVFTCGSTDWADGLAGNDPIVDRMTRNVLDRLAK